MPTPKHSGQLRINLCDIPLDLRFKARNMMVLSDLTKQSPVDFFGRFSGLDEDDLESVGKIACDLNFLVPLLVAGVSHAKEYRRLDSETVQDRICDLLDKEADKQKKSLFQLTAELSAQILPVAVMSLSIEAPEPESGGKGNEQEGPSGSAEVASAGES